MCLSWINRHTGHTSALQNQQCCNKQRHTSSHQWGSSELSNLSHAEENPNTNHVHLDSVHTDGFCTDIQSTALYLVRAKRVISDIRCLTLLCDFRPPISGFVHSIALFVFWPRLHSWPWFGLFLDISVCSGWPLPAPLRYYSSVEETVLCLIKCLSVCLDSHWQIQPHIIAIVLLSYIYFFVTMSIGTDLM